VDPVAGVVQRHAPGGHQLDVRKGRANILDVAGAERGGGKHLDDVGACIPRVEYFRGCQAPGHCRHVSFMARLNHRSAKHRTHNVARPRIDGAVGRLGVEHRPCAKQKISGKRWGNLADEIDCARHRHRDFQGTDAARRQRVNDGA